MRHRICSYHRANFVALTEQIKVKSHVSHISIQIASTQLQRTNIDISLSATREVEKGILRVPNQMRGE